MMEHTIDTRRQCSQVNGVSKRAQVGGDAPKATRKRSRVSCSCKTSILVLPTEIQCLIFSNTAPKDLITVANTSSDWRALVSKVVRETWRWSSWKKTNHANILGSLLNTVSALWPIEQKVAFLRPILQQLVNSDDDESELPVIKTMLHRKSVQYIASFLSELWDMRSIDHGVSTGGWSNQDKFQTLCVEWDITRRVAFLVELTKLDKWQFKQTLSAVLLMNLHLCSDCGVFECANQDEGNDNVMEFAAFFVSLSKLWTVDQVGKLSAHALSFLEYKRYFVFYECLIRDVSWSKAELTVFLKETQKTIVGDSIAPFGLAVLKNWKKEGYLDVFSAMFTGWTSTAKELALQCIMTKWTSELVYVSDEEGVFPSTLVDNVGLEVLASLLVQTLI